MPKSLRVYIRREKARLRKRLLSDDDYARAVNDLYIRLAPRRPPASAPQQEPR